jgi:hypothetical protein
MLQHVEKWEVKFVAFSPRKTQASRGGWRDVGPGALVKLTQTGTTNMALQSHTGCTTPADNTNIRNFTTFRGKVHDVWCEYT